MGQMCLPRYDCLVGVRVDTFVGFLVAVEGGVAVGGAEKRRSILQYYLNISLEACLRAC